MNYCLTALTLAFSLLLAATAAWAAPQFAMARVPGGCFQRGDSFGAGESTEKPVREVCVDEFFIGRYEVTQAQWQAVMGDNPSKNRQGGDYPVEMVSWQDVQQFLASLNQLTGKAYRLPSEAEWEFAARSGGRDEKWPGPGEPNRLFRYINFCDMQCNQSQRDAAQNDGFALTAPVGSFAPNGLGIHDMGGNVWEWVQDWYDDTYYGQAERTNPRGPKQGSFRVLRGGSWANNAAWVRAAKRYKLAPHYRFDSIGFRLALGGR